MHSSASSGDSPRVSSFKSWSPGDLADGGFVDQLSLRAVGNDGGNGLNVGIIHDDGVALHMAEASGVAHHLGIEHLTGGALGHGPGNHPATGTVPIQR